VIRRDAASAPGTIKALITAVFTCFKKARLAYGHGTTNAWDEAVWLVLHTLRLPFDRLTPLLDRKVPTAAQQRTWNLVDQRIRQRTPVAYLTREAWLDDYRFYVDPRVLVPRSFIAELLRNELAPWIARPERIKKVLDLGTGSGCLAVLLAKTFPRAQIDAVDISRPALAVARRNLAAYRLQQRVRLLRSDMFSAVKEKRYDLIVSNPPYVSASAMRALPREYRHEPTLALAGGRDGFDLVRVILQEAARHLTPDGMLVVEIGHRRKRLEAKFPHTPFAWPVTSGGDDCVFILGRRDLPERSAAAHRSMPANARPRRPRVRGSARA
jgi:ribosomal protein L3 glutamine methyltransferase